MTILVFSVVAVLFLLALLLDKILRSITLKELKRRARSNDAVAQRLYKMSAYGPSADFFIWFIAGLCLAGLLIVISDWQTWSILLFSFIVLWFLWGSKSLKSYGNWLWLVSSFSAIPLAKLLSWLQPVLGRFAGKLNKFNLAFTHTGIYEKADLMELLNSQNHMVDNRVSEKDLKLAFHALQFGDKTVGSVMKPRKAVMWVSEDEPIGPLLMDELHASGLSEFPVVKDSSKKSASPEVVGTLYLKDLVGQASGGKARDLMQKGSEFINEASNLREALAAFSKTRQHLLLVINNFEEIVGVLTLGQLLEQILGEKLPSEFDQFEDKSAVAGKTTAAQTADK